MRGSYSPEAEACKIRKKVMISHPLRGVLWENSKLQEEEWFIGASNRPLPLLLPCARCKKRVFECQGRNLLALGSGELKTISPDQVEGRILPMTLEGGTLSWLLMRHNRFFTGTNAAHQPDSRWQEHAHHSRHVLSPFLSSIW